MVEGGEVFDGGSEVGCCRLSLTCMTLRHDPYGPRVARSIRKKSMKLLFPAPLPSMRTFKLVSSKFSNDRIDLNPSIVRLSSACVIYVPHLFTGL